VAIAIIGFSLSWGLPRFARNDGMGKLDSRFHGNDMWKAGMTRLRQGYGG